MEYRILDDYRLFSKMAGFSFSVTARNQKIYEERHQEIFHEKREFLGAFDNKDLAAGLILYPYMMNFRNNLIKTFGVGDVCSRADKRGKGEVRYLLNESVRLMHSRSAGLSVLYPFNYDFYRGSGWEVFTNSAMYLLSPSQLKTLPETDNIKAVDMDFPDKQGIEYYNKKVCGKYNHVIRSEIDWKDQLRMFSDNEIKRGVVQFYKNSQVCGMMTYVYSYIPKEDSTVFTIRTFFYDDFETKNKMFLFIKKLSAQ
ncbi:MAG TPA: GNAT family N-acetyltransferase, partial [Petrotogaceae bacterium]|nr:GNAT family N-acetyltransferase [Petrotogaceae bacterium]